MSHSPYAPPIAPLAYAQTAPIALYSPTQAAVGALLGGPVGLIYFLRSNFAALGNEAAARKCVWAGALLVVALLIVISLLPPKFPSSPFNIAYILVARGIAEKYQRTKADISSAPEYEFQSNWKVLGFGLLCLAGSAVVIIGPLMVLTVLGLVA